MTRAIATTKLDPVLDRLAAFTGSSVPVVSVYLDLRSDDRGRDNYENFLDSAFSEQIESFPAGSEARLSLENDIQRVRRYLESQLRPSTQSLAIFSSSGEPSLYEALQLDVPIDGHRVYVDRVPHLFPLARLNDQYATYAALLLDTTVARLYVFAVGAVQRRLEIETEKTRTTPGAWMSQPRYQRHLENLHLKHMKEVAEAVGRVVREDRVRQVVVVANDVALPLLKEQLAPMVRDMLVELDHVDVKTPESAVLRASLNAFRHADASSDSERVEEALGAFRSGGLGSIGVEPVRSALTLGQVDRLLVPSVATTTSADEASPAIEAGASKAQRALLDEKTIEEFVTLARRTDAQVTFIEEVALLEPAGGVAALLRFHL